MYSMCILWGVNEWWNQWWRLKNPSKSVYLMAMPPSPVSSQLKELLKTCLSQIYIKLTWSNDDPLKCFCLKCHIWWEINQTKFPFGVYRSVSVLFNFFLIVMQNVLSFFSRLSCVPNDRSISNFYGFVSLCIWWITLPATVLLAKKCFCNVPLNVFFSKHGMEFQAVGEITISWRQQLFCFQWIIFLVAQRSCCTSWMTPGDGN